MKNCHRTPNTIYHRTRNTTRLSVCTTEKYMQNYTPHIVSGNRIYPQTIKSERRSTLLVTATYNVCKCTTLMQIPVQVTCISNPLMMRIQSKCNSTSDQLQLMINKTHLSFTLGKMVCCVMWKEQMIGESCKVAGVIEFFR